MERASSKHSPRVDDEMAQEVRGIVQGTAGGRAQEWKMPEPPGEDQPGPTVAPDGGYGRGEYAGVGSAQGEEFSRFGSYLPRSFPADRDVLVAGARTLGAPDDVLRRLAALPPGTSFRNAAEVWAASQAG
jgi:hypothetical protein